MNKINPLDRILSICGVVAPIFLALSVFVAGSLHPNYSHLTQAISELGAKEAPFRTILNYFGLIPAGALTFVFSIAIFRYSKGNIPLYISAGLVSLIGLGRFLAGVFPCDPGCAAVVSTCARLHVIAGFSSLASGAVAPLVMAFGIRHHRPRIYFFLSLGLGIGAVAVIMIGTLWLGASYIGISQRLLLTFTYLWIITIAVGLGAFGHRSLMVHKSEY